MRLITSSKITPGIFRPTENYTSSFPGAKKVILRCHWDFQNSKHMVEGHVMVHLANCTDFGPEMRLSHRGRIDRARAIRIHCYRRAGAQGGTGSGACGCTRRAPYCLLPDGPPPTEKMSPKGQASRLPFLNSMGQSTWTKVKKRRQYFFQRVPVL